MSKSPQFQGWVRATASLVIVLSVALGIRAELSATGATQPLEKSPTAEVLPGKGPVQRGDWFDNVWGERRAEFRKHAAKDQGAVVFLGDSITQGWGDPGKHFPKYRCANRGISGDTTRGVLYRLTEDVLALHPAAVVLLIGTNDIGIGADPTDVAANLEAIPGALRASNAKLPVIVCQVMPSAASGRCP